MFSNEETWPYREIRLCFGPVASGWWARWSSHWPSEPVLRHTGLPHYLAIETVDETEAVGKSKAGTGNGMSFYVPLGAERPGRRPRVYLSVDVGLCLCLYWPHLCCRTVIHLFSSPHSQQWTCFPIYLSFFPPPLCLPFPQAHVSLSLMITWMNSLWCIV